MKKQDFTISKKTHFIDKFNIFSRMIKLKCTPKFVLHRKVTNCTKDKSRVNCPDCIKAMNAD